MQDKKPRNEKRQKHGHWQMYYPNGTLYCTINYINGEPYGYLARYYPNAKITNKEYHAR